MSKLDALPLLIRSKKAEEVEFTLPSLGQDDRSDMLQCHDGALVSQVLSTRLQEVHVRIVWDRNTTCSSKVKSNFCSSDQTAQTMGDVTN